MTDSAPAPAPIPAALPPPWPAAPAPPAALNGASGIPSGPPLAVPPEPAGPRSPALPADAPGPPAPPGVLVALAVLPPGALLSEPALAAALGVHPRSVRRGVRRGELPPPVRLGGRSTWLAERVLAFLGERAAAAERQAERDSRKFRRD